MREKKSTQKTREEKEAKMSEAHGAASYEATKALFEQSRFRTTSGGRRKFHRILDVSGSLVSESKAAFTVANEAWVGGSKAFLRAWFKDERARSYEYIEHSYVRRENRLSTVYYAFPEPRYEGLVTTSTESERRANIEYFLEYVLLLVGDNPAHVEWMVLWLADILVNPHDKGHRPIAVVLCGAQGAGKSSLRELMARLLGDRLVCRSGFFLPGDARWKGGAMLKYKLFVEFENIDFEAYRKTANSVKAVISDRARTIEQRGADPIYVTASERVLITTSAACKMAVGSSDPLFAAFAVSARRVGDTVYWTEHYRKLGSASAQDRAHGSSSYVRDVAEYLLSRKEGTGSLVATLPVTDSCMFPALGKNKACLESNKKLHAPRAKKKFLGLGA